MFGNVAHASALPGNTIDAQSIPRSDEVSAIELSRPAICISKHAVVSLDFSPITVYRIWY